MERPVDLPSWHEFDYSAIARNFVTEGNNILYPRIDWRRDGPGFTEMEFPAQPWVTAQLYRAFGMHDWLGRIVPLMATLLSLGVFAQISRLLLPEGLAWVAVLFFAANRTVLFVASAMQPEAMMLLFYLLTVYFFLRWLSARSWWLYGAAVVAFASAMLMKSPAAHLGIFFFLLAYRQYGFRLFKQWELWFFVLASFTPVILWYSHAFGLWKTYHNSLGVSNEDHWIGFDILRRPKVALGLVSIELVFVLGLGGAIAIAFGFVRQIRQQRAFQTAALWLVSIAIYYLVIIRTAGQYWAWYYHVVAVPPVALLMAAGISRLTGVARRTSWGLAGGITACLILSAILAGFGGRNWSKAPGVLQDLMIPALSGPAAACLSCLGMAGVGVILLAAKTESQRLNNLRPMGKLSTALLAAGIASYFLVSGQLIRNTWSRLAVRSDEYACIGCFADKIQPGLLIVSSGGICKDAAGRKLANDAPEMFYWLNHKGFSTCEGEQSVEELREDSKRGARYFIANKATVREQPLLEKSLRENFALLGECKTAWLFELKR